MQILTTPLRSMLAPVVLLALLAPPVRAQTPAQIRQSRALAQEANAATRSGKLELGRSLLENALALRPGHAVLMYNLARVQSLLGNATASAALLQRAAQLGLGADITGDSAFAAARVLPSFDDAAAQLRTNRLATTASDVAFHIPDDAFLAEGIAWDPAGKHFFVSSVHQRRIVRVDSDGVVTDFIHRSSALWSPLGIAVDSERRALWVTSAALPESDGVGADLHGRSAVHRYSLTSGALEMVFTHARDSAQTFGDLTIDRQSGDVFVSDATAGIIYRIAAGSDTMEVFVGPGVLDSPQGIAIIPGSSAVMVADYSSGLWRIDRATRHVTQIAIPDSLTLIGVDGIAVHGTTLIAVQNYFPPHRVLRLHLNDDQTAVTGWDTLEQNHAAFDEPTLGTVVGDSFYYIANSQWGKFTPGSAPPAQPRTAPIILRLKLGR